MKAPHIDRRLVSRNPFQIFAAMVLLLGPFHSAPAGFIAGLDGTANSSSFETGAITNLPLLEWTNVEGTARVFDAAAANGSLIGTGAFELYTVQYTPAQPVALTPGTRYTLSFDMGFVAGVTGGTADYRFQMGVVANGIFTGLGTPAEGTVSHTGNLYGGVVSGTGTQEFVTNETVPAGSIAVQFTLTGYNGGSDFFGFDAVTLDASPGVIVPDTTAPALVSAGSLNGATIALTFNEPLDAASAVNAASYTLPNGVTLVSGELLADQKTVVLTVTGLIGPAFSLTAGGVRDPAGNAMSATPISGTVVQQPVADVGFPVEPGMAWSAAEGSLTLRAGGNDVWFNADSFVFAPTERTGDFDVRVQVASFGPANANPNAKALLMVRETPDAESRHVSVTVYPQMKNWTSFRREASFGASSVLPGNFRVEWPTGTNFPNAWLRLRRSGQTFTTYGSMDGEVWTQVGESYTPEEPYSATVQVGMGATSVGDQFAGAPMVETTFRNFGNFGLPGSTITFVEQPKAVSALENTRATFEAKVAVTGTAPENVDYQWLRDGAILPGANAPKYITGDLLRSDNGAKYQLRASVSGGDDKLSNEVILTVIADISPPQVTSAISLGGGTVMIQFNEALDAISATQPSLYTLSGGASVLDAMLQPDGKSVLLFVSGITGSTFQVTLNGVSDLALNPTNGTFPGVVLPWASDDIGIVDPPGSARVIETDAFEVSSAGADIWLTQDSFHFLHQQRTGDFDVRVQMSRLDLVNAASRGGLMVREDLSAGSRNFFVGTYAAAGDNHWVSTSRMEPDGDTSLAPGDSYVVRDATFSFPDAWFRLMRAGNTFTAYYSTNGLDWIRIADQFSPEIPYPETIYLGLATASIVPGTATTAVFRNFGNILTDTADLTIVRTVNGLQLSWPADAEGFSLFTTADLVSGPWVAVSTVPVAAEGQLQVTLPSAMAKQFFRLQK